MKTFQGVISNWRRIDLNHPDTGLGFRIEGICRIHMDQPAVDESRAALRSTIQEGRSMYTSYVVGIEDFDGYSVIETRNSRYILIGPERK